MTAEEILQKSGIDRQRTAITRGSLSKPMAAAKKDGLLAGNSVFDYGCGRGDDIKALKRAGITASGWDPYYAKDAPKKSADIVNLGYVINVIENASERASALKSAYRLAKKALVVAARTDGSGETTTSANTFQKYYTQESLGQYIKATLGKEPVSAGSGVYYVFKDKSLENKMSGKGESLEKSAKGGKYYRRVPRNSGKGYTYYYDEGAYKRSKRSHVNGAEAAKETVKAAVLKTLDKSGSADVKEFKALVKRYGSKLVGEVMREAVQGGKVRFEKGRLHLATDK